MYAYKTHNLPLILWLNYAYIFPVRRYYYAESFSWLLAPVFDPLTNKVSRLLGLLFTCIIEWHCTLMLFMAVLV